MNGLIEQWGHISTQPSGNTFYFDIIFSKTPVVICKPNGGFDYSPPYYAFGWGAATNMFSIVITSGGQDFHAIGY